MPRLHIANTNFEWELLQPVKMEPQEAFKIHPLAQQLQFVPFYYASAEDGIVVTAPPSPDFAEVLNRLGITPARLHAFDELDFSKYAILESWGPSLILKRWAEKKGISYSIPDWKTVKTVNSKKFSFLLSPRLPGAELLQNADQARHWILSQKGKCVLKTCYGFAGTGHLLLPKGEKSIGKSLDFLKREWSLGFPVVGEPWVERLLDFSSQWFIHGPNKIEYLASTRFESDARGCYRCGYSGEERELFGKWKPFLDEHLAIVKPIVLKMAQMRYLGNIGIDAFVYQHNGPQLHPVVEINGRKTLGWFAHTLQQRQFPGKLMRLEYAANARGISLLPKALENQTQPFRRRLCYELISRIDP